MSTTWGLLGGTAQVIDEVESVDKVSRIFFVDDAVNLNTVKIVSETLIVVTGLTSSWRIKFGAAR